MACHDSDLGDVRSEVYYTQLIDEELTRTVMAALHEAAAQGVHSWHLTAIKRGTSLFQS